MRRESLYENFLNSHVLIKREQELDESWRELRSECLHKRFLNSHVLVKRELELHESWEARVCMKVIWTPTSWSNQSKLRVAWKLMSVYKREFVRIRVFSNSHVLPSQTRIGVDKRELLPNSLLSTLISVSNEDKSCMSDSKLSILMHQNLNKK